MHTLRFRKLLVRETCKGRWSECVRLAAALEPVSLLRSVVTDYDYHLVELGPYLNAASKSAVCLVIIYNTVHSFFLSWRHWIDLAKVWVRNNYVALSAGNTRTIVVVWHLIWSHSVFLVTSLTVTKHAWRIISLENIKKTLTLVGSVPAWNTIWRNDVNPNAVTGKVDGQYGIKMIWLTCDRRPWSCRLPLWVWERDRHRRKWLLDWRS